MNILLNQILAQPQVRQAIIAIATFFAAANSLTGQAQASPQIKNIVSTSTPVIAQAIVGYVYANSSITPAKRADNPVQNGFQPKRWSQIRELFFDAYREVRSSQSPQADLSTISAIKKDGFYGSFGNVWIDRTSIKLSGKNTNQKFAEKISIALNQLGQSQTGSDIVRLFTMKLNGAGVLSVRKASNLSEFPKLPPLPGIFPKTMQVNSNTSAVVVNKTNPDQKKTPAQIQQNIRKDLANLARKVNTAQGFNPINNLGVVKRKASSLPSAKQPEDLLSFPSTLSNSEELTRATILPQMMNVHRLNGETNSSKKQTIEGNNVFLVQAEPAPRLTWYTLVQDKKDWLEWCKKNNLPTGEKDWNAFQEKKRKEYPNQRPQSFQP